MDIVSHVTAHVFFLFMATSMSFFFFFKLTHSFFFFNKKQNQFDNIGKMRRLHTSVFEFPTSLEKSDLATLGSHVSMATMGSKKVVLFSLKQNSHFSVCFTPLLYYLALIDGHWALCSVVQKATFNSPLEYVQIIFCILCTDLILFSSSQFLSSYTMLFYCFILGRFVLLQTLR